MTAPTWQNDLHAPTPSLHPLVDRFGRMHTYLRISVTERCDLRCRYCMPPEGIQLQPRTHILSLEEIEGLARLFIRLGVKKLRLTGGEPMVRRGILDLLGRLSRLQPYPDLGMTTNGVLLADVLPEVLAAGVTAINLSLDTWKADRFEQITLRPQLPQVLRSLDGMLASTTLRSKKLNCVMMRGVNDDELLDFVAFTRDHDLSVRFIEYMPFSGNGWDGSKLLPYQEMLRRIREVYPLEPLEAESRHDTASRFRVPGFKGTLGFISSMTDHFCGGCNRIRLTADGNLKNCLFDHGEVSLRDPLRAGADEEALISLIAQALQRKFAHHGGHETPEGIALDPGRSMIQIGG